MSMAEKFIKESTRNCSNKIVRDERSLTHDYIPWLIPEQARKAVEITREEELEYVKYQLELRLPETLNYNGVQVDREDFISDFIKAIKNE